MYLSGKSHMKGITQKVSTKDLGESKQILTV